MEKTIQGTTEFIDKCTARWLFEKTGVQLYDEALRKCPAEMKSKLQEIRDQEKQHEEMLEEVIRRYGADPHTMTESARITKMESEGIVNVVQKEGFSAVIDALLTAELVDNASWELLKKLAKKLGDDDAADKFDDALDEEEKHLVFIRDQVMDSSIAKLQGKAA